MEYVREDIFAWNGHRELTEEEKLRAEKDKAMLDAYLKKLKCEGKL